jgi:hypothetical protein
LRVWSGFTVPTKTARSAKNPSRRERCRLDLLAFGLQYFPQRIQNPQRGHLEMVAVLMRLVLSKQSIAPSLHAEADPRGFGKTTWLDILIIWAIFYGHRSCIAFIAATGPIASARIKSIQSTILNNPLLAEDFCEIVDWLHGTHAGDPRSAPPDYPWSGEWFRLPNGCLVVARGVDSSIAGINNFDMRPDLVLMDDCETGDIARSTEQIAKLRERITKEVLHLHEKGKPAAYVFVNTIRQPYCLTQELTDPKQSPQWSSARRAALIKEPTAKDLWARFVELCSPNPTDPGTDRLAEEHVTAAALEISLESFSELLPPQRNALRYYAARKIEMDAGVELLDPIRMPLWYLYLERAKDESAFQCELQNNPPEDANQKVLSLDLEILRTRKVTIARGLVPEWADFLTVAIDVGQYVLHWQADAWRADGLNLLVDQGQEETRLNAGGEYKMTDNPALRETMVERALQSALTSLHERFTRGWLDTRGNTVTPALVGVDSGGTAGPFAWYGVILKFCAARSRWIALKGQSPWSNFTADAAMARNWLCRAENNPGRRHDCNVDAYKKALSRAYESPIWVKDTGDYFPGARILHKDTPDVYLKHQTSERYIETLNPKLTVGKDLRTGWNRVGNVPNHWWDTAWMSFALADIYKFTLARSAPVKPKSQTSAPNRVVRRSY